MGGEPVDEDGIGGGPGDNERSDGPIDLRLGEACGKGTVRREGERGGARVRDNSS